MGTVAFDPTELYELAGQLTAAAAALGGIGPQVAGAANDPGLLPSGAGLAGQALAATAGLAGISAELVTTAAAITSAVNTYETTMAATAALPPVQKFATSPLGQALPWLINPTTQPFAEGYLAWTYRKQLGNALNWANNTMNAGYGAIGGAHIASENYEIHEAEQVPVLGAGVKDMTQWLGTPGARGFLTGVSNWTNAIAVPLGVASGVMDLIPGADVVGLIVGGLGALDAGVNLAANEGLAAGGEDNANIRENIGSDDVSLATFGLGAALGGLAKAPRIAESVSKEANTVKLATLATQLVGDVETIQSVPGVAPILNYEEKTLKPGVSEAKQKLDQLNEWIKQHGAPRTGTPLLPSPLPGQGPPLNPGGKRPAPTPPTPPHPQPGPAPHPLPHPHGAGG